MGFVGTGGMGRHHIKNLSTMPGVQISAVCDADEGQAEHAADIIRHAGHPQPAMYTGQKDGYQRLCAEEDLDLVYTATPWEVHTRVCLAAMENGKHAATEVPAAVTIEECWQLVETAEKTGKYCVMSENCCYDQVEMMLLNMVRQGLFGELIYAECGYMHDLRSLKFWKGGEGLWRLQHTETRNGDLYPTHGLGPVAQWFDINHGNRFTNLVSMSTRSRGLNLYAAEKFGPDSPEAQKTYALGDVVTTLLQTAAGQTILVKHDTSSPRPYSRAIMVQGTRGLARKYPEELIHIEGRSEPEQWEPLADYREAFEHPLWQETQDTLKDVGGHGNMDYLVDWCLIRALQTGNPPDMDVYDAATWSAVTALSAFSIRNGSQPVPFPDFTRGKWKER
ncbi:MAG: Gfo/Idh/MocA family oxidoreductase [Anaerolineae bacterium]|nr:Gfo/Idh/MocA family oxidoreductase [Anaerolineae bacterium]